MNAAKPSYRAVTRQIEVKVTPQFLSDRSAPENGYFFWAYTIKLTNLGGETVQLKTRHWRITDANGKLQEVRGAGVVGETPLLKPGEEFEYTQRRTVADPVRLHGRQLRHGDGRWRGVRHRGSGILARYAAEGADDQLIVRRPDRSLFLVTVPGRPPRRLPRLAARTRKSNCKIRRLP